MEFLNSAFAKRDRGVIVKFKPREAVLLDNEIRDVERRVFEHLRVCGNRSDKEKILTEQRPVD